MYRLSRNSEASTSWNLKGLSRPAAGKLYLTCLRRNGSQWIVADVCWEEVLVLAVKVGKRKAREIHQTNLW
jgi:hypothetical protein